jgi:hypothetical protein
MHEYGKLKNYTMRELGKTLFFITELYSAWIR